MKILVCVTHVPDTTSKISFTENDTLFNSANVQYIIGPYDEYALSRAIELKETFGGTVTVINVGTAETESTLRKALALGADDAIRVNSLALDSSFVASEIAKHAKGQNYDLIMMGRESIDYNGGVVHSLVAEILDMECVSPVTKLDLNGNIATLHKEIEGGNQVLEAELPLVLGCQEPIAEWKIPNMRGIMSSKSKPLVVIEPTSQSAMVTVINYQTPPAKSGCKMIDASEPEKLIELLRSEAKVL